MQAQIELLGSSNLSPTFGASSIGLPVNSPSGTKLSAGFFAGYRSGTPGACWAGGT